MEFLTQYELTSKAGTQTHLWSVPKFRNKLLSIPKDQLETVYRRYVEYIARSGQEVTEDPAAGHNALVEKIHTTRMRFFLDIDFDADLFDKGILPCNETDLVATMRDLVKDIHVLMGDVIADRSLLRTRKVATRTLYTLHVHYPDVVCSKRTATRIRKALVQGLAKKDRWTQLMDHTHGDFMDAHVYSTGLRMLGSHKGLMNPRKTAEKKAKHLRLFSAESWSNVYRITHPETFQRKTDLTLDDVMATSIFAKDAEQEVVLRDDLDNVFNLVSERQLEQLQNNPVPCTSGFTETVSWLRQRFNHVLDPSKGKIFPSACVVFPLTTRDCLHARRAHRSNHQFLKVTSGGASQMCHSCKVATKKVSKLPVGVRRELVAAGVIVTETPGTVDPSPTAPRPTPAPALDLTSRDIVGSVTVTDDPYTSEDKRSAIRHEMAAFVAKFPESIEDLDQQPCDWVKSPMGYHVDLEQHWCAVCRETHADPQCAFNVVENGKMYISCFQRRYLVFPEDAQPCVSELKRNVLFFNVNVSIQQTIVNNYASVDEVDIAFDKIQFTDDPTLDDLLYDALTTSTYSIARLVWYLARERFNYVSRGVWYEFKDHYWVEDRVQSLIVFLSTVVAPFFRLVKERYMQHTADPELLRSQTKKLNALIAQFTNIQMKERIVKECQAYFLEHDFFFDPQNNASFERRLDTANNLVCFSNGVYDLDALQFRRGMPQDCVTHSCRYPLCENSDPGLRQKLVRFIYDIQPHAPEREYMLTHLASCLHGDNLQEIFHIYTNQGRNGKSALADLLRATFGDYYGTIPAEMLTRERAGASAAQPELINLKGKRLVIASEPKASERINTAFVKLLTGNDEVSARRLYSGKIEEFRPQFQMILLANDIPLMDSSDNAIYMRSRILEFPTTFVANPRLPHEKMVNESLKAELPTLRNEFMLYLIDYYKDYVADGRKLRPPPSVLTLVEQHRYNSDPVQQFWVTRTEDDPEGSIQLKALYDTYKLWYSANFNGRPANVNVFRKQLEKLTLLATDVPTADGRGVSTGVRGRRFKDVLEDDY